MEEFVKGDVVIVPFPFSDLSSSKKRPALILINLHGSDVILCQITSKMKSDGYSISLGVPDFETGSLLIESYIRPNRIFTAEKSIIQYKAGRVSEQKLNEVKKMVTDLINE